MPSYRATRGDVLKALLALALTLGAIILDYYWR